jgi:hypothetical protein
MSYQIAHFNDCTKDARPMFCLNPVASTKICSVLFHFMFVLCVSLGRPCLFNDKLIYKPVKLINSLSACRTWWRTKSGRKIRSAYMTCFNIAYCLTNRWQCTIIDQPAIAIGHIQAKTWDVFWMAAGYYENSVNNYKCVIDTHIILVPVVRSIQNSCIKYSTQNQRFAKMFTYSDNTNLNLNLYYFIVSI